MSSNQTATDYGRRRFFKGARSSQNPVRPPWALSETDFVDQCERCDKCVSACEENIIVRGDGGFPEVRFLQGECTFCEACVEACNSGALQKIAEQKPFQHVVEVKEFCFAKKGIVCQTCADECEARAIGFRWERSIAVPVIEESLCTGCGACIAICPHDAITVKKFSSSQLKAD